MFHVVLYRPEIPPNTGNVIRLCANTGITLHLVGPLGFSLDEPRLRRAGLDYHEWAEVRCHDGFPDFLASVRPARVLAFTTRARRLYNDVAYRAGDALLFGPETSGLPESLLGTVAEDQRLRIPMRPDNRSLNLSNAVAVACFEAWRQHGYEGAA